MFVLWNFLNSVTTFAQESSTIIHNKNSIILKLNGDQKGNFELIAGKQQ